MSERFSIRKKLYTGSTILLAISIAILLVSSFLDRPRSDDTSSTVVRLLAEFMDMDYVFLTSILCVLLLANPLIKRGNALVEILIIVLIGLELIAHGKLDNLGSDSVREILNTNRQEAIDYIRNYVLFIGISNFQLASMVLLCIPVVVIRATENSVSQDFRNTVLKTGIFLISAILIFKFTTFASAFFGRYHGIEKFTENIEKGNLAYAGFLKKSQSAPHVVLYIGESTAKENMGLYGYYNDTTEPLKEFRQDLIVFSDVISAYSATFPALYRAFTVPRDPYLDQFLLVEELQRASVIDVLNKNDLATYWLSNQNVAGFWDWASQLFGRKSKESYFLNKGVGNYYGPKRKFDSDLIEVYLKKSIEPRRIDFLHSYAGHFDYCGNIPPKEYREFDDPLLKLPFLAALGDLRNVSRDSVFKTIRCYDATVHHISNNIAAALRKISTSDVPTVFIYFSDHGEDVFGATGHESRENSFRHLEVPLLVYFNPAAKAAFPAQYRAALRNKDSAYSLEWMSDSILHLAGFDNAKRNWLSIFSDSLKTPQRYSLARTSSDGKKEIVAIDEENDSQKYGFVTSGDDFYQKKRLIKRLDAANASKVCSHRTDSVMKWVEAAKIFKCLESDIFVDLPGNELYVFDASKSSNMLRLRDLLRFKSGKTERVFLSVKNLDASNVDTVVSYLNGLIPEKDRSRVVIKATEEGIGIGAAKIKTAGYRLSYILPTEAGVRCSNNPKERDCIQLKERALALLAKTSFNSLSFDIEAYKFVSSLALPANVELAITDLRVKAFADINQDALGVAGAYVIPFVSRFDY